MKSLFIDCSKGISGDMLLAAFLDLGLPEKVLKSNLVEIGLGNNFEINFLESKSYGLRVVKINIKTFESYKPITKWLEIKDFILNSSIKESIKEIVLKVFNELAFAEAIVHGCEINDVHFHEIASIETLVNIYGVCVGVDFFRPKQIYCISPPAGSGKIKTSHGFMPVPVPVVLEIARRNKINLQGGNCFPVGELTTPTGIALISILTNKFEQPYSLQILKIGVGLGSKDFGEPNFLRVCEIENLICQEDVQKNSKIYRQNLVIQEAWIDDASLEDIGELINQLRSGGAIEVVCNSLQMKKGRQGINIKALVHMEFASKLRLVWFIKGTTIGIRESYIHRWSLPRRMGYCNTTFGDIKVKQVKRPDGSFYKKPEYDDLVSISAKTGKSLYEIRKEVLSDLDNFIPNEDWSF